jgi:fibronectin-binding autotransporter adhesin
MSMRGLLRGVVLATAALCLALAPTAAAKTLCVAQSSGCYHAIQPAVDAAHAGDTVRVAPGTFAGGVTIAKSIRLQGAGAGATRISGGGPVLTLGTFGAASEPTIAIDGVTVTHGKTTKTPDVDSNLTYIARGGGIFVPSGAFVPPGPAFRPGATVTITNTVVTGNEAAPASTAPSPSGAPCPGGDCPYAEADGGGIDTSGSLTLDRVVVSNNRSDGPLTSDADGAGIYSHQGDLTIRRSVIAHNAAVAVPPNGRFAEGGGMFVKSGTLSIDGTSINDNTASLTSTLPSFAGTELIEMNAHSGGLHVDNDIPTTIRHTKITNNSVSAVDPNGEPASFDSAMLIEASPLTMDDTVISGNDVRATKASSEDVGTDGSALEVDGGGTITNTRITDNTASAFSGPGVAAMANGLAVFNFSDTPAQPLLVADSVIDGNRSVARSTNGTAIVEGGGVFNNSLLELRRVLVTRNSAAAFGPAGHAQGGGVWNGVELSGPPVQLTLTDSAIARNTLTGGPAIALAGGGLFTTEPVTRTRTTIAANRPDQCSGC